MCMRSLFLLQPPSFSLTDEGDKVLVLASASGSELIACAELGRSVVGIELDGLQYEACNDRLRCWWTRVTSNLRIWHEHNLVPTPEQQATGTYENQDLWSQHVEGRVGLPGSCFSCGSVSLQESMDSCSFSGHLFHSRPFARTTACRHRCADC